MKSFLLTLLPSLLLAGEMRTWLTIDGDELSGEFVRQEGASVFIKGADGETTEVKRSQLSPNDLKWIDKKLSPQASSEEFVFTKATQGETARMEIYRNLRRLIVETLAKLKNNAREDKRLAFIIRDADKTYGWESIYATFYYDKLDRPGKIKILVFRLKDPAKLREACAICRDKFVIPLPDSVGVKRIFEDGDIYWEVSGAPKWISRILMRECSHDGDKSTVDEFELHFPPPL